MQRGNHPDYMQGGGKTNQKGRKKKNNGKKGVTQCGRSIKKGNETHPRSDYIDAWGKEKNHAKGWEDEKGVK